MNKTYVGADGAPNASRADMYGSAEEPQASQSTAASPSPDTSAHSLSQPSSLSLVYKQNQLDNSCHFFIASASSPCVADASCEGESPRWSLQRRWWSLPTSS